MGLILRMILYSVFSALAYEGALDFNPDAGTITVSVDQLGFVVTGVLGYLGTFGVSRWVKAKGGKT